VSGAAPSLTGRKVLVVDDEPYIVKILSFKLRLSGMVPLEAGSGEEALRLVREESPDLVLLDISLSRGLTGLDLCRIMKEVPSTSAIPVIMLTARSLPSDRDQGLALGASAYITKPFSTRLLIQEIERVLSAGS
jgi:CheY-like chemotaxis protein